MPIKYRDRLAVVLHTLETSKEPEAHAIAAFIRAADKRGHANQTRLSVSFEHIRALASWAKAFVDQE